MKRRVPGVTFEFWSVDTDHYAIKADDIDKLGWSDSLQIRLWRRAEEYRRVASGYPPREWVQ